MFIYRHPYASPLKEEKVEPAVEGNFFIIVRRKKFHKKKFIQRLKKILFKKNLILAVE